MNDSVIYELHVKGFTYLNPEVPEPLRGTYMALASPAVIDYLKSLGVTAVELMPVHHFTDDRFLVDRGLRNYWGYSTLNFFSPDIRYSQAGGNPDEQVRESNQWSKPCIRQVSKSSSMSSTIIPPRATIKARPSRCAA